MQLATHFSSSGVGSCTLAAHYCLGAHLARLELTEALRVITQRMPNPRLTGPTSWPGMAGITGPRSVPLEFDRGH